MKTPWTDILLSYGFLPLAALALFNVCGILCGVHLYRRFGRYKDARATHERWQILWASGCAVSGLSMFALLPHVAGSINMLMGTISSLLWISAFMAYRRAKAQDAIPLPRYDDPQEGVWPPPPANLP